MKKIKVEIEGISPLMMTNPKSMLTKKEVTGTTEKYDINEQAENYLYKSDGKLYIPCESIKGCIIDASSYKKIGKYSAKPIIAGAINITPAQIILNTNKYEIDYRTVVLQRRNRIPCARPVIKDWKVSFDLNYNEKLISNPTIIKSILEEGGERVGILAFRPAKLGSFGMFKVTKWKEE